MERGPPVELNKDDSLECSVLSEPFLPALTASPLVSKKIRFAYRAYVSLPREVAL